MHIDWRVSETQPIVAENGATGNTSSTPILFETVPHQADGSKPAIYLDRGLPLGLRHASFASLFGTTHVCRSMRVMLVRSSSHDVRATTNVHDTCVARSYSDANRS